MNPLLFHVTGDITKALNINLLGSAIRCHFYTKVQRPQNEIRTGITAICRLQKNEMRDDIFWVICGECRRFA